MSIRMFDQLSAFEAWAQQRARLLAMEVEPCTLEDLEPDWKQVKLLGRLKEIVHHLGLFFRLAGIRVLRSAGREVPNWKQPMIFGSEGGYVGLITCSGDHPQHGESSLQVLVRMMAEPGNKGIEIPVGEDLEIREGIATSTPTINSRVLVAPAVQFSLGNLENHRRALRGELDANGNPCKPVPFASFALDDDVLTGMDVKWFDAAEDGGRFFEKFNHYGLIFVPQHKCDWVDQEVAATGCAEDFAWVSRGVLSQILRHEAGPLANGHLRSVSSLLI